MFKFGRKEHDPMALASQPAHRFGVSLASPVVDRRSVDYMPQLYGNDRYSDCTCVALANYARGIAALNGYQLTVDEDAVFRFFGDVGQDTNLEEIPGLVATDVLLHQAANGFNIGPQMLVGAAGTVANDRNSLSHAMERLGGVYLGVRLYERDMDNIGKVWVSGGNNGALVGRHMINGWDYSIPMLRLGTWGMLQSATWDWLLDRIDEAHAVVWRQLARASDGRFYSGVNADGLVAEL